MRTYWVFLAASCSGIACVQLFPALPSLKSVFIIIGLLLSGYGCLCASRSYAVAKAFLYGLLCFVLGLGYSVYRAQLRLDDALSVVHENRVSRLLVQVNELALYGPDYIQF
ncbi:MAG: hypothetical protein GX070_00065, partial [Alcaligenaceae bacterium]|nr:hypothetical protein [Alcaligenaceae bacterium]